MTGATPTGPTGPTPTGATPSGATPTGPTPTGPTPTGSAPAERGSRGARFGVMLLLGLVAAWFTWDAVGNLVALPELLTALGLGDDIPWALLVLGVAMPAVYFGAALAVGHRLPLARLALVLIASLGAIAATRLTLVAAATGIIGGL